MSYNYLTQRDSPNYTPASQTRAVWEVDRNITKIAIHWWDDPAKNPSFEGVVNLLCNPAREASAHYVATGTGRRVACLVSPNDNSWATNSANPYTISIECDPRCRDEDYDVVAELIADIRSAYGDLPLMAHRDVVATRCPGDYDLGRLDQLARTKFSHATEWGQGGTIPQPVPQPTPVPTPQPAPEPIPEPTPTPEPTLPIPEPTIPPVPTPDNKDSLIYKLLTWLWEKILAYLSTHIRR